MVPLTIPDSKKYFEICVATIKRRVNLESSKELKPNTNMTTTAKIKAASSLTYNPNTDELFADGKLVGGASDLTRDLMLDRLAEPADHADDSDETLFDLVVEAAE